MSQTTGALPTPDQGHERGDVSVRPLLIFLGLLAVGCVVALFLMRWLFNVFDASARARDLPGHPLAEEQVPAAPRLQADPPSELEAYLLQQEELQSTYGWLDPEAGVVRVPIDRAIDLVLERGLPVRDTGEEGGR